MPAAPHPPRLDRVVARLFDDQEPTSLGSGWLSGTAAVFLGTLGLGAVACLRFPELLTSPLVREVYALSWIRPLIATVIGVAFVLGLLSALLRRRKVLGLTGMGLALVASLAGGASVPVDAAPGTSFGLGLDWFLLNLLLLALLFVPMDLVFVSFHAVFIHANVRFPLTHVEDWVVTPRFHHWHHSAQPEAIDKNFAVTSRTCSGPSFLSGGGQDFLTALQRRTFRRVMEGSQRFSYSRRRRHA